MKRNIVVLALAMALMASGLHALDVTAPAQGEAWCKDNAQTISWNAAVFPGAKVKLILFKQDQRLMAIAEEAANSGSYSWTPPHSLMEDRKYQVLVRTLDNSTRHFSGYFMLKNCGRVALNDPTRLIESPKVPQDASAAKPRPVVPHIDRLAPTDIRAFPDQPDEPISVFGRGFGASQGTKPKWNILVAKSGYTVIPLQITSWSDGLIRFKKDEFMEPGDWVVYVCAAYENACETILSNQYAFHVAPQYYSYIYGIEVQNAPPNSPIPAGDENVALRITGLGFNAANAGRGVIMRFNSTQRSMTVDSWSDTVILGRISTLLIPPGTECRFSVYHTVNGADYPSNTKVETLQAQ